MEVSQRLATWCWRPTTAAFEALLTGRGHRPTAGVVLAELGNDAGVVGAADLARHR